MAVMFQPWLPLYLFLLAFIISALPFSHCQFGSPQNIETFYPFDQAPSPNSVPQPPIVRPFPPATPPQPAPTKSSTTGKIVKAVAATAAGTLVVSALLFFLVHRGFAARRRGTQGSSRSSDEGPPAAPRNEFSRVDGDLKGFIVDEDGLDVLYWRKLEGRNSKKCTFRKEVLKKEEQEQEDRRRKSERQEVPLLRGKSSASHVKVVPEVDDPNGISPSTPPPPSSPPPTPTPTPTPTPPPPPPPPPPPFLAVSAVKRPAPPPLPPRTGGSNTSLKPPPARPKGVVGNNQPGESSSGTENGHVKMKPLHWDKVNTNTDHSMVWDKIDAGSFRFDGDLMEHLFGYVATNNKSPERNSNSVGRSSHNSYPPAQIFILDPRRSQNIAIVLKSLAISRKGIVAALIDGHGLDTDTLEKLVRIAPSNEEHAQILEYEGDLTRLADAESFLYHLLKAVPSAFTRLNAMLFRTNYDLEILFLKQSIQTLELGCKELKTRGLFMKLLEATLKAGNRMNAGTARGNAQAFDLNALRKLSDVKSSDGRTTLLHFVVEEVVRSEGKRCVLSRNRSMSRSMSRGSSTYNPESLTTNEERDKEYKLLGLPMVGGLSAEFSNVKKAATIDYDTFASTSAALTAHAAEIRALNSQCANDRGGGFVREMEGFLEAAEEELKVLREEETRVMDLVKKTTEYYQAGASKDKAAPPLQLFVIVKDFLSMVDQVCVEIVRSLQKRRTVMTTLGSSSPNSPPPRGPVRFPNLPENFLSDKSMSSSSESDDF